MKKNKNCVKNNQNASAVEVEAVEGQVETYARVYCQKDSVLRQ